MFVQRFTDNLLTVTLFREYHFLEINLHNQSLKKNTVASQTLTREPFSPLLPLLLIYSHTRFSRVFSRLYPEKKRPFLPTKYFIRTIVTSRVLIIIPFHTYITFIHVLKCVRKMCEFLSENGRKRGGKDGDDEGDHREDQYR